ncbi:MAG TPA: 16S rRNA (uracil(1498)-N(3))-methyltransferase, partial [Desulfobulbus sp.]|nr:16S rRNA (uracil(1498)-N(3))-methyltransferase [Desulfobulbus sp.]
GTVVLTGRRADHIRNILRPAAGDTLRVGEINGAVGSGVVEKIDEASVVLTVDLDRKPPSLPDIELILALPRPIMLQRIVKQATTLGVRRFHLIRSRRVEKSFFHSPILGPEKMRSLLTEGLEQAMDTRLPEVRVYHRFKPFVEDVLPTLVGYGLLAHPSATDSLSVVGKNSRKNRSEKNREEGRNQILLAVGPEGGFSDYECRQFLRQGFTMFTMGPRILHVDTAVVALLAQILLLQAG